MYPSYSVPSWAPGGYAGSTSSLGVDAHHQRISHRHVQTASNAIGKAVVQSLGDDKEIGKVNLSRPCPVEAGPVPFLKPELWDGSDVGSRLPGQPGRSRV
ncbi:hypothetical protein J3F84DRAFT_382626 [Trichoderma pleuroticola]